MAGHREFYPYSGPATAALGAIDAIELAYKKANRPYIAEELKKDRELLVEFLRKNQAICVVKVRKNKPKDTKEVLMECKSFEAFLKKELVTHGRFDGGQQWVLYLIPLA